MSSLSEQLRSIRERQGLSLEALATRTKIQAKYLHYLENEEFDKLPAYVYTRGFIQKWANVCGIDAEPLVLQFYRENKILADVPNKTKLPRVSFGHAFIVTSRHMLGVAAIGVIVSILGYFLYTQNILNRKPSIEVTEPSEYSTVSEGSEITIRGQARNVEQLFLNDRELEVHESGSFEVLYPLQAGLNTIFIKAVSNDGVHVESVRKVLKVTNGVERARVVDEKSK